MPATTATKGRGVTLGYGLTVEASPTLLGKVTNIKPPKLACDDIDITNSDSPDDCKESDPGWTDADALTATLIYENSKSTTVLSQFKIKQYWTVTFSNGAKWKCYGYLKSLGDTVEVNGACHTEIEIKNASGRPTYTAAA